MKQAKTNMSPEAGKPTNAQVLGDLMQNFDLQEDFIQEMVAEHIACPKKPYECEHYGDIYSGCTACKVQWLKQKWDA